MSIAPYEAPVPVAAAQPLRSGLLGAVGREAPASSPCSQRHQRPVWQVLGTQVDVIADDLLDLTVTQAFLDAYEEPSVAGGFPPHRRLSVRMLRSEWRDGWAGRPVEVHRTKHAYWTFDGLVVCESPRCVVWPTRRIACKIEADGGDLEIAVADDLNGVFASEAVFHAIRSVALPQRPRGALLHASGVVHNGLAILFCGDVLAGKTTLMTESVLRLGASPLANDRVLVAFDRPGSPLALSWPSYASYCEGTLLHYPELSQAAVAYEGSGCSYKTQSWPAALEETYDKSRKRIYPMRWFADAADRRYVASARIAAMIFPRLALDGSPPRMRRLDAHEVVQRLRGVTFGHPDPSFRPWHGLTPKDIPVGPEETALQLGAAGIPVVELITPAETLAGLHDAFDLFASSP